MNTFDGFKAELKFAVIKLLQQRKRKPSVSGSIPITAEMFTLLETKYGLTGHFKIKNDFFNDLDLICIRFFHIGNYCEIKSFSSRISKNKDEVFLDNEYQKKKISSSLSSFKFRFFRYSGVV